MEWSGVSRSVINPTAVFYLTLSWRQVQNVMKGNSKMEDALQRITGHTVAKIHEDFQRDFYLSSAEAVQYGIIDEVLLPREKVRQDVYKQRGVSYGTAVFSCAARSFVVVVVDCSHPPPDPKVWCLKSQTGWSPCLLVFLSLIHI